MYKLVVMLLLAGISPSCVMAKSEVQGSFGLGYAAQYIHESLPYADKIIASNASVSIVFKNRHNFRYRAGIEYLTTGYTGAGSFIYIQSITPTTGGGYHQIIFRHIGIPLALGYQLRLSKHMSIVPELGLLGTYNLGASDMRDVYGATRINHDWEPVPQKDFNDTYKRYSLFGTAKLALHYKVKKWVCFAGPSFYLMTSDLSKHPLQFPFGPPIATVQKEYQLSFNIGMSYRLASGENKLKKKHG